MKFETLNITTFQLTLLKDVKTLIIFLSTFFLAMGSQVIAPALPKISSFYNLTDEKVGLIMSFFTLPTIILSPFIGSLSDRYGRKIFLSGGIFLYGISGILPIFINYSFNNILLFRAIQGIGFAAAMPLTVAVIGDLYIGKKEVTAQGIRAFFIESGGFVFPLLGGALTLLGWNYTFLSFSLAIPFSFFVWFYFPETVMQISKKPTKLKFFFEELNIIKNVYILMILFFGLIRFFFTVSIIVYLPLLLVNKFMANPVHIGVALGLMSLFKAIFSLLVGNITAIWGMHLPIIFGFFVYGLGCFFLPLSPSFLLVVVIMIFMGSGDGILAPIQKSLITQSVKPKERAAIVSINASLQGIGRTFSPIIIGIIIINSNLRWGFWSITLLALVPIVICFCFRFLIIERNQID